MSIWMHSAAVAAALAMVSFGCAAAAGTAQGGGAATTDATASDTPAAADAGASADGATGADTTAVSDGAVADTAAGAETLADAAVDAAAGDGAADTPGDAAPDLTAADGVPDTKPDLPPTGCTCADVTCGPGAVCVPKAGECKKNAELKSGQCWADANCPAGVPCIGAFVCPCDADCDAADSPGVCGTQPACSCATAKCGAGSVCVPAAGGCKSNAELKAGQCWTEANCPTGQPCIGTQVCPCNADCGVPDKPGSCGVAPVCTCNGNKCAADQVCLPEPNVCVSPLKAGQCWADKDCAGGQSCQGAFVCPCNGKCPKLTAPGICSAPSPCNCNGNTCAAGQLCLPDANVCTDPLKPGQCFADKDCPNGLACQNAFVCPCNAKCAKPTTPGTCGGAGPICTCEGKACGAGQLCVADKKVCVDTGNLPAGQCWTDAQCPGGKCEGANICPCGAACFAADKPGTCDQPPQVACKCTGKPCGADQVCAGATGICKNNAELKPGQCWSVSNCGPGQTCDGTNICPCGAMCLVADKPGTCSGGGGGVPACQKVDPFSFGMCEMVLGVVFDGKKCVFASGCGCADKCALIFKDMTACQLACGLM